MANKLTKKYIGTDQVGSVQLELENNLALRANNVSGVSLDILKIDASNLFQLLQHPYLPGPATAPEQAARQQEVDNIATDVGALEIRMDAAETAITSLEAREYIFQYATLSLFPPVGIEQRIYIDESTEKIYRFDGSAYVELAPVDFTPIQNQIDDLVDEDLTFVKLDGSRAMTGSLSMMPSLGVHYKVTGLADPTDARDAANKQYVDAVAEGLHVHAPVKVIINQTLESASGGSVLYNNGASGVGATLTLSVPLTIYDTYTFQNGDRVIVNGQANKAYNGIYTVGSNGSLGSVFTRALDYNTPTEMAGGDFVFVQAGDQYDNTGWVQVDTVLVVGTDPVEFVQFSGTGSYTAGDGLFLDGTEFNVKYDNTTIKLNGSNQLVVSSSILTDISTLQTNVTNLQTEDLSFLKLNGTRAMTGALGMGGFKISNLANPTLAQDAATKAWVESQISPVQGEIDALELVVDAIQADVNILIADMSIVQSDISALQSEDLTFLKLDGTRAMTGALAMGGFKISNLADPTLAQDAATKSWVMSQIASGTDFEVQKIILSPSDITNQYIDLSFKASQGSVICSTSRVNLIVVLGVDADADFRQDNSGAVTRLHFQGPSASAGESSLSAGQILYFNYVKA